MLGAVSEMGCFSALSLSRNVSKAAMEMAPVSVIYARGWAQPFSVVVADQTMAATLLEIALETGLAV